MSAEAPQAQPLPPEVVLYRPAMCNVLKGDDGTTQLEFMISPIKVVAVLIPEDAAKDLAAAINSGVIIASGLPV